MKFYFKFLSRLLPSNFKLLLINKGKDLIRKEHKNRYDLINISYSQEGEDLILKRFFKNKSNGFYVDIGAHHPKRFSNSFIFYKMGWSGINIDAMPNSMLLFNEIRPRDINLEIPISDKEETLKFYIFNEPALNTFSEQNAQKISASGNYYIDQEKSLRTRTLKSVLDEHLPPNQHIDFLSIDVEGLDLKVLQSNDWQSYRPDVILVEDLLVKLDDIYNSSVYQFLKKKQYSLLSKTINTLIFVSNKES